MKIAVLIAGPPRFSTELDTFINSLRGYDQADWFFYLWKNNNPPDKHDYPSIKLIPDNWRYPDEEWAKNKIIENLPKNHRLVDLKFFDPAKLDIPDIKNPRATIWTVWRMFFSWHQADLLRQAEENRSGKYDIVIRHRPDAGITNIIDLEEVKNKDGISFPNHMWYGFGNNQICDIMAAGNSEQMKIYSDAVNHLVKYANEDEIPYHPETMLAYHLQKNCIPVLKGNWGITLRSEMVEQNGTHILNAGRWA
jgi:hypothetical protein